MLHFILVLGTWRDVSDGTAQHVRGGGAGVIVGAHDEPGDAEVGDERGHVIVEENVARLEVAVDDLDR